MLFRSWRASNAAIDGLKAPVILTGSGILWSGASAELQRFVDATGVPFYTTPQGRGVVPEDHALCFPNARSTALKEADAILVVGTRVNYVFGHMRSPRFRADAKMIRIDIDPAEIGGTRHQGSRLRRVRTRHAFLCLFPGPLHSQRQPCCARAVPADSF